MDIKIKNLSKSFSDQHSTKTTVLQNISLTVPTGSVLHLTGKSGCGKSTLMNCISGLLLPDNGTVIIDNTEINTLSEAARDNFRASHIGYIFQTFNLLSPLSALENVIAGEVLSGKADASTREKAYAILETLGLKEHCDKFPYQLSVGQRQRVAIARALLKSPAIVIADEPTASLDTESAEIVGNSLKNLKKDKCTLIIATHDPTLKIEADQVLNLEKKGGLK